MYRQLQAASHLCLNFAKKCPQAWLRRRCYDERRYRHRPCGAEGTDLLDGIYGGLWCVTRALQAHRIKQQTRAEALACAGAFLAWAYLPDDFLRALRVAHYPSR